MGDYVPPLRDIRRSVEAGWPAVPFPPEFGAGACHGWPDVRASYGDGGGAVGYLIGEASRGMRYMFTMMNNARATGLSGVDLAGAPSG